MDCATEMEAAVKNLMRGVIQDVSVALMTYASDLFSWYAGSLDADVYFCPERQGTYYGSFYIKDAPAIGHEGYKIDEKLTADVGQYFLDQLATTKLDSLVTDLVDKQRNNLYAGTKNIVQVRTDISVLLRSLITTSAPTDTFKAQVLAQVLEKSGTYGELDGKIVYLYTMAFAQVYPSITNVQKTNLVAMRKKIMSGIYDGLPFDYSVCTTPFLYSAVIKDLSVLDPYISNTDYLFGVSGFMIGSNSIDATDVIKITDMSGLLPDDGKVVIVKAWDKNGNQLTEAGYASPLSIINHGTTSIRGEDLEDRFPDGAPAAYSFSVESSKMFITIINSSSDGAVRVPIIYSNGLSNFVSNSIGSRNTIKVTDMSGAIASSGIAIIVTAWDATGKAIPESTSAAPLKLYSHGTTTIAGSTLPARFPSGTPMTYEFTIASPKLVISNIKNSSDGTLNIPTVYTIGISNFVANSIGFQNTIYISDFSGALDVGGAAIKVRAWDVSGTEIPQSESLSSYTISNYETVKITGAELTSRFSSGIPMTYEFTVGSSKVVITNVKSSSDGNINIPTVYTNGITNYTTNYVSDLNTIQITDMSGGISSGGASITIKARDVDYDF